MIRPERDEETGQDYVKVPMPESETLQQALQAFSGLLESLRK